MILRATETTCEGQTAFLQDADNHDADVEVSECATPYGEDKEYEFGGNFGKMQKSLQSPQARAAMQRMAKVALARDGAYGQYVFLSLGIKQRLFRKAKGAKKALLGKRAKQDPADEEEEVVAPAPPGEAKPLEAPAVPKCATGKPNCPRLLDAVGTMVSARS